MARHRRADRDLGGLLVADLADQDRVGIGAQDRPEPAREGQPRADVHLDLVDAGGHVLDRILDRHQRAVGRVQLLEGGVERRRLAAPRRAAREDGAEWLVDRLPDDLLGVRGERELGEGVGRSGLVQDTQRHLLPELRGQDRHAQVDRLASRL